MTNPKPKPNDHGLTHPEEVFRRKSQRRFWRSGFEPHPGSRVRKFKPTPKTSSVSRIFGVKNWAKLLLRHGAHA